MVRATAALLLLLRDAEAAYIAVVGPTGDDVIVTDLTPVRLQLDDDESYGLLYEDGELLTELPHKNWVATHFPPCYDPPISRETAANVALAGAAANAAWGFEALGDVVSLVAVWKSTSGTPRPAKTSNLSITSKSIRLILGRIDGSRRVLEKHS